MAAVERCARPRFVIQEHHARALHWDLRLERDGVLVSWAVPEGLPVDCGTNHLAVQTDDHPMAEAEFRGRSAAGQYGTGWMSIWDQGTYEPQKWTDSEVTVVLHGARVQGRYVLFAIGGGTSGGGREWMVHRMDPPSRPDWTPLPRLLAPLIAVPGQLPPVAEAGQWAYEPRWDGVRAVAFVEGGRLRLASPIGEDITRSYPEVRGLAEALGSTQVALDGELVTFDPRGRLSRERLAQRAHCTHPGLVRRLSDAAPVVYLIADLLHLEGRPLTDVPYRERRRLLEALHLTGAAWRTSPSFPNAGEELLSIVAEHDLPGVLAKRLDAGYRSGRSGDDWLEVRSPRLQEVIIGGWRRSGGDEPEIGALLVGVAEPAGLRYAGRVRSGLDPRAQQELYPHLARLECGRPPFAKPLSAGQTREAHWVAPRLVGEVAFSQWSRSGLLIGSVWRRLISAPGDTG